MHSRRFSQEELAAARAAMRVDPSPRLEALMTYAIEQIVEKLRHQPEYKEWLAWAEEWRQGQRSPSACVSMSHRCKDVGQKADGWEGHHPVWSALGQVCWGAKEACYSAPKSGWLVIRYIADAMLAFDIAFPDAGMPLLEAPTIETEAKTPRRRESSMLPYRRTMRGSGST